MSEANNNDLTQGCNHIFNGPNDGCKTFENQHHFGEDPEKALRELMALIISQLAAIGIIEVTDEPTTEPPPFIFINCHREPPPLPNTHDDDINICEGEFTLLSIRQHSPEQAAAIARLMFGNEVESLDNGDGTTTHNFLNMDPDWPDILDTNPETRKTPDKQ